MEPWLVKEIFSISHNHVLFAEKLQCTKLKKDSEGN